MVLTCILWRHACDAREEKRKGKMFLLAAYYVLEYSMNWVCEAWEIKQVAMKTDSLRIQMKILSPIKLVLVGVV